MWRSRPAAVASLVHWPIVCVFWVGHMMSLFGARQCKHIRGWVNIHINMTWWWQTERVLLSFARRSHSSGAAQARNLTWRVFFLCSNNGGLKIAFAGNMSCILYTCFLCGNMKLPTVQIVDRWCNVHCTLHIRARGKHVGCIGFADTRCDHTE